MLGHDELRQEVLFVLILFQRLGHSQRGLFHYIDDSMHRQSFEGESLEPRLRFLVQGEFGLGRHSFSRQ